MRLKTYNTDSVQAALRLARIELGDDAVLIGSNENSKGLNGAKLRVTFGTDFEENEQSVVAAKNQGSLEPLAVKPTMMPEEQPVLDELRRMRIDLDSIRRTSQTTGTVESAFTPVFENRLIGQLFVRLVTRGVSPALAARLAAELESESEPESTYHSLLERLRVRIRSLWKIQQSAPRTEPEALALVGSAGAGKTSTLAKLAMLHGAAKGRSVGFICVDPFRVGGVDHLEAYASLFDAPLRLVDQLSDLPAVIDEIRSAADVPDLLLLDTAGYPLRDAAKHQALHRALQQCSNLDVHLTINATSRTEDIRRGYEAFGASAKSLIFTRLDEASAPGVLLDESLRFGLPIAYLTAGQGAAHDLSLADPDELTMLAVGRVDAELAFA